MLLYLLRKSAFIATPSFSSKRTAELRHGKFQSCHRVEPKALRPALRKEDNGNAVSVSATVHAAQSRVKGEELCPEQ